MRNLLLDLGHVTELSPASLTLSGECLYHEEDINAQCILQTCLKSLSVSEYYLR